MPLFFFNLKNVGQDAVFVSICVILQPQKQYQIKESQSGPADDGRRRDQQERNL